jgi:hypothetical protein
VVESDLLIQAWLDGKVVVPRFPTPLLERLRDR